MRDFKRVLSLVLAAVMIIGGLTIAPVAAKADVADHVVIHEVYGGGGNSKALYTNDYIVLYNPTKEDVSLEGWAVHYASAAKDFGTDNITSLEGTIKAGGYYLIQEAAGSTVTDAPLPVTPDARGAIAMAKDKGVVALAKNAEQLTGKDDTDIVDLVGFGSANKYEGTAPTAAISNTTSVKRTTLGVDTNDNGADFTVGTPDLSYLVSTEDDAEVTTDYYLIGYINGADYGCNDDWENLGDYKFVDGKVTVEFEQDSYVFVKSGDNSSWYMTSGWQGTECTETTLYNTANISNGDKLYVPAGKEIEITLVNNGDDTFTLSYEEVITPTLPTTPEEIVNAAYALETGKSLDGTYTLTGIITSVDTAYSEQYKNVTVTIQIGDMADKLIMCYRLKGDGADVIAVGDEITVTGTLTNYNGTIEFVSGCTLDKYVDNTPSDGEDDTTTPDEGGDDVTKPTTPEEIINAAYALETGASLDGTYTLTGIITSVDSAYSEQYGNITVTMVVGDMTDKPIECFRLKGDGADKLGVGDEITVTGTLTNYNGKIEFAAGCTLDSYKDNPDPTPADIEVPADATDVEIVELANTLVPGQSLVGNQTLTGVIVKVDTPYDEGYQNITITIQVGETEDTQILVYRVKGDGADKISVDDTVTVTGIITNYKGTIEFTSGCTLDSYTLADGTEDDGTTDDGTTDDGTTDDGTTDDGTTDDGTTTVPEEKPAVKLEEEVVAEQVEKLEKVEEGTDKPVIIDMQTSSGDVATEVPAEILDAIKGKDIDVVLDMIGYTWTINGKDVVAEDLEAINLEVAVDVEVIEKEVVEAIAKGDKTVQLSLTHDGDFGFDATLTINVGKENAGAYGNLYYYNAEGKLVFMGAGLIDDKGNVDLGFEHASDYVVVIGEDRTPEAPEVIDPKGDIPVVVPFMMVFGGVALAAVALFGKKKMA